MKKTTLIFIFMLLLTAAGLGLIKYRWGKTQDNNASPSQSAQNSPTPTSQASDQEEKKAAELEAAKFIEKLTPEQKIKQVLGISFTPSLVGTSSAKISSVSVTASGSGSRAPASDQPARTASASANALGTGKAGDTSEFGFITLVGSPLSLTQANAIVHTLQPSGSPETIPPAILANQESATKSLLSGKGFTVLPIWPEMCATPEEEMNQRLEPYAGELKIAGINGIISPLLKYTAPSQTASSGAKNRVDDEKCPFNLADTQAKITAWQKHFQPQRISPILKNYSNGNKELFKPFISSASSLIMVSVTPDKKGELGCAFDQTCMEVFKDSTQLSLTAPIEKSVVSQFTTSTDSSSTTSAISDLVFSAFKTGNTVVLFGPTIPNTQIEAVVQDITNQYQKSASFQKIIDTNLSKIIQQKMKLKLL